MASGQAPFGVCRRLDEAYLKTVLEQDEYALVPSETGSLVKDEAAAVAEPAPSLDLAKAIRHTNFGALHRLLTFPLTEMISTAPPNLPNLGQDGQPLGFLVIYGVPGDYMADGITWLNQEKQNLKLIVFDTKTSRYKIRNSKLDGGEVVMRRHKRVCQDKSQGWQRHEYKLFSDETATRQNIDGTKTIVTRRTLNPWPVLVHYFRPTPVAGGTSSRQRSSSTSLLSSPLPLSSPSSALSTTTSPTPPGSFHSDTANSELDDGTEYLRATKRAKTGHDSSRDTRQILESDSEAGSITSSLVSSRTSAALSNALQSVQLPLFQGELAPIVNLKPSSSDQHLAWPATSRNDMAVDASPLDDINGVHMQTEQDMIWQDQELSVGIRMSDQQIQPMADADLDNLVRSGLPGIFITHYAPDTCFSEEECQVLIVLGAETLPLVSFVAFVDGLECDTTLVSPGVLRIIVPKHGSGVFPLWLVGRDAHGSVVTHSESLPFYFLPSNEGALTFAHATSSDYFTDAVFYKFRHTTRKLDLTGNNLMNIDLLAGFSELRELVLDHNSISHHTHLPSLPKLTSLSINHNEIAQINTFVIHLLEAGITRLKFLSLLGNVANPAFDRLEHRYYNFRIYVISKLQSLRSLDSRDVTDDERKHSFTIANEEAESASPSSGSAQSASGFAPHPSQSSQVYGKSHDSPSSNSSTDTATPSNSAHIFTHRFQSALFDSQPEVELKLLHSSSSSNMFPPLTPDSSGIFTFGASHENSISPILRSPSGGSVDMRPPLGYP